jgi:maleate isomerase
MNAADYGARARVGVATPQANPTVEPEMRLLLPAAIGVYGTRLVHPAADVESRLDHYIRHLPDAVGSFGSMRLAAFGFGCTGSSYRAGPALEDELTSAAASLRGIPVITAAQAIRLALRTFGARRIALISPYPTGLAEAGYAYWKADGLTLVETLRVDPVLTDTHRIYELTSDDAYTALASLQHRDVDAILVSGTGMPTLNALRRWRTERGATSPPVLSSNLCLAWALLQHAAPELAPKSPALLIGA